MGDFARLGVANEATATVPVTLLVDLVAVALEFKSSVVETLPRQGNSDDKRCNLCLHAWPNDEHPRHLPSCMVVRATVAIERALSVVLGDQEGNTIRITEVPASERVIEYSARSGASAEYPADFLEFIEQEVVPPSAPACVMTHEQAAARSQALREHEWRW